MARKPWQTKEWRASRDAFLKDKVCIQCGSTDKLTIHHPQPRNSISDEEYLSFRNCQVLCGRCHFALHRGMILCPKCRVAYRNPRFPTCAKCAGIQKYTPYEHPWCKRTFQIETKWWDIEASPHMCCIELCRKFYDCKIQEENWEKES